MSPLLIRRTTAWRLTLVGWSVVLAVFVALSILFVTRIHGFLSVATPLPGSAIIVPGMLPDEVLGHIVNEAKEDPMVVVITVGGPISRGSYLSNYQDYASLAAGSLLKMGVDPDRIIIVPSKAARKDRTFESALALRAWLDRSHFAIGAFNVYTMEIRARRTRILFSKALGKEHKIGIVTFPDRGYDPAKWWSSSQGVRTTLGEFVAYIYVRLFFHPTTQSIPYSD